jgi:predicted permease
MGEFLRRIQYLLNRRKLQRELENDMEFHREMMSAESRNDFGNPVVLRERAGEAWGWSWLDRLFQDLRFGARMLKNSPALTLTAVAVLALGIGVNVTAFNIADAMFFKPLPVRDPQSLVRFTAQSPTSYSTEVAYPAVMFYGRNSQAISAVLAQTQTNLTLAGDTNENVRAGLVTGNYFSELGASAAYGRLFNPKIDEAPNAPAVAVLGYQFWQRRFGSDAGIVGQTIRLNQLPVTVIGVAGFDFSGLDPERGEEAEVWLVISKLPYLVPETKLLTSFDAYDSGVHMWGRLKPGITQKYAEAALEPLAQELVRQHPGVLPAGLKLIAGPGGYAATIDRAGQGTLPLLGLIATLVFLILAAACGNLGNLLLGHAVSREHEISIRLALGATRARILRQLMTESMLLASLGTAVGLVLSWVTSRALFMTLGGPGNVNLSPDWRTILFAVAAGVLSCALFGLSPARQASRQTHRQSRARTIFMTAQVAASCVLLVVGALLVRAVHSALTADPGFDYAHVITVDPQLYEHGYTPERARQYLDELQTRAAQIPGVEAATVTSMPPLGNRRTMGPVPGLSLTLYTSPTAPGYFKTMSIPLLRGRDFRPDDRSVAIVSDNLARQMWPGKDPLQQTYYEGYGGKDWTIVGVAGNARTVSLRDGNAAEMYIPIPESKVTTSILLTKTSVPPEQLASVLGGVARSIDPALSPEVRPLHLAYEDKVGSSQQMAVIASGMGLLALLLAVVGLYGVVAHNLAQSTREIGIRIALGAPPARLVRSVVSRFFAPLGFALGLGLVLAAALSMILRSELYGISNFDVLSYVAAVAILSGIGGLAALIPARRALRVNPIEALRSE